MKHRRITCGSSHVIWALRTSRPRSDLFPSLCGQPLVKQCASAESPGSIRSRRTDREEIVAFTQSSATAAASNQIDSIRQFIPAFLSPREMPRELIPTQIDCRDEPLGDASITHVSQQRIKSCLPFRLAHSSCNPIVNDDTCIALGEGD